MARYDMERLWKGKIGVKRDGMGREGRERVENEQRRKVNNKKK